jgi:TatD DNase family protein
MELFDSHAHLEASAFDLDRDEVIARARCAGVTRILSCGTDLPSSRASVALAAAYPGLVWATVGIHPHSARDAALDGRAGASPPDDPALDDAVFAELAALAAAPRVAALGELGLDYYYDYSPRPVQRAVLARQLALAAELDLPVILHNRESDEDLRRVVDAGPAALRGVLHCFLADAEMAAWALDRGLYLGVAGPITFKGVRHLAEILRAAPLDRLLIETDSPYLAPHPLRGRRNEPAYVAHVAARLAEVLGLPAEELAARTAANARQLLRIDPHGA